MPKKRPPIDVKQDSRKILNELRTIFDSTGDGIIVTDTACRITRMNRIAENLTGWSEITACGKHLDEIFRLVNETSGAEIKRPFEHVLHEGKKVDIADDTLLIDRDGAEHPITDSGTPILDEHGALIGMVLVFRDQTAEQAAQRALKESEELHRITLENITDPVFITDDNGKFTFICPNVSPILGYSVDEIQAMGNISACVGEGKSLFNPDELRKRGQISNIETVIIGKNGPKRNYLVTVKLVSIKGGTFLYVCRDITEHKQAQEQIIKLGLLKERLIGELSFSEKQKLITDEIVSIFNADIAGIWLLQTGDLCEKGCLHAQFAEGPNACRNRARCLHLVASSGFYTHIDGMHRRIPFGCYQIGRIATGEESWFITNDITRDLRGHDREWAHSLGLVSCLGFRLVSEKGEPIGVLALFSKQALTSLEENLLRGFADYLSLVIQADKAREAMLESEEKFRMVANFTYAMETWQTPDGIYRYVSPSSARITGYTAEEFLAEPNLLIQITHPNDRSKVIEHFTAHNQTGEENMGIDFRILTPGGDIRCLCHSCTAVRGKDGQFLGRRGSFREITKLKRSEEEKEKWEAQKRRRQKAESLGRMAAAIAHHFNNKLQVVIGYLELVLERLPKNDKYINDLTSAKQAVDEAAEMSRLMLVYLGQVTGPRELLDLSEICEKYLPRIQSTMPTKLVLQTDLPSPGPTIVANSKHIQLIITSLIVNAWEAVGDKQGTILLSVKMVSSADIPPLHRFPVNWQPEDTSYVCLEIRDTGCGITAKDIEKAFDPFFSTKFVGRGLGLPVVLGLVQAHGGVISVESKPGRGSAFRIFFPLSGTEVHLKPDKVASAPEMQWSGTVLLVDDDKSVLEITRVMLSLLGFEVLSAEDGIEAVEVFRQHKNDISFVLTDFDMPRMNGLETVTALRQIAPGIPVILASGYSKEHVMDGTHPVRLQAFLGKPYSLQALKDAICSTLQDK